MSVPTKYHGLQITANCIQMLGVSILSFCFSQRIPKTWRQLKYLSWGRICVLLVVLDSWLFVFLAGILSSGIGLSWSHTTCTLAITSCISFYAISKVFIYAFLSEKVYIVWTGGNQTSRLKTKVYRLCASAIVGYVIIAVFMVLSRQSKIRGDGVCIIGLKPYSTISLIAYDLLLNIFLTTMFLWPLWVSHPISPMLRSVATRTLYGAVTSLISSAVNVTIITALGGTELGLICLSSCVTDAVVNSVALFWVSSSSSYSSEVILDRFSLPTMDMSALTFVQSDSIRQTGQPSRTLFSNKATLPPISSMVPEAYYDYLPADQRGCIKDDEARPESPISTPSPVILKGSYSESYSESLPNSPTSFTFASSAGPNHPPALKPVSLTPPGHS